MKNKRRMPARNRSSEENIPGPTDQCLSVQEEIWRIVEEAADSGKFIAASATVRHIESAFPQSGLSARNIADALVYAAVDAGVLLEHQQPMSRQGFRERLPRISFGLGRARPPSAGIEAAP
jgi:hypothetical protein